MRHIPAILRSLVLLAVTACSSLHAATEQTQSLTLSPGWNAVWLEVEPRKADGTPKSPEEVFTNQSVQAVARFLPARGRYQFITDPSEESLGDDFWLKWRRGSVLGGNTLGGITGNTAYLILNSGESAISFDITGAATFHRYQWTPDSFNFFGVPVESTATAPTISAFFTPSGAHPLNRIYKLTAGKWAIVQSTERIQKGAAYWVYCQGGSAYQGPLPVIFSDSGGYLDFGVTQESADFSAGNLATSDSSLVLQRIAGTLSVAGTSATQKPLGTGNLPVTSNGTDTGPINPQSSATIRLSPDRDWNAAPAIRENLYKIRATTGGGIYYQFLPVRASIPLAAATGAAAGLPGLWVGDVVLTHATSLVRGKIGEDENGDAVMGDGPRLEPVKRPMRYRVILHTDHSGVTKLLGHATLMKKIRTSEDLPEEFVIVINDEKIPNFIGIETRGGKLVGKRFDTAGYDLPRETPPTALDNDLTGNPYLTSLPMSAPLAPGGQLETRIVLDPWHRTHPYKHVYNPEHRQGFPVTRDMTFTVDAPGSPEAAATTGFGTRALGGVFEESIQGLMKTGDTHETRGRFILQRVSDATTLQ